MSLRNIQEADLELILSWRNHPAIRTHMFSQSVIELEQHLAWFQCESAKDTSIWLLYLDPSNTPAGVVYFTDIDWASRNAFWGFYAAPNADPGTGTRMTMEALDFFFSEQGFHKLNAEVLEVNERSLRLHQKLGFQKEGWFRDQYKSDKGYLSVARFGLLTSEWGLQRICLRKRCGA